MTDQQDKKRRRRGWGEGRVEEVDGRRFKAIVRLGKDASGKYRRKVAYFDTKKEALTWIGQQQTIRNPASAGKTTVGQWLDQWLEIKKAETERNTHVFYERRVRLHIKPQIGAVKLGDLRPAHVRSMLSTLADNKTSVGEQRKAMRTLRTALKDAVGHELIPSNPAAAVRMPKDSGKRPEDKMQCFDAEQARRFLDEAKSDRLHAMYEVAIDSGMRPGELFGLRWPDLDLEAGSATVRRSVEEISGKCTEKEPKTGKTRAILLAKRTLAALRAHRERMESERRDTTGGLVFCNERGGYLRKSDVRRNSFIEIIKRAKLPKIRLMDLRHTSATLLLAHAVDIKTVSERLGHAKIQITLDHYAHVLPVMQERAVQAMAAILPEIGTKLAPRHKAGIDISN